MRPLILLVAVCCGCGASGQPAKAQPSSITFTRGTGGTIVTTLSRSIKVNDGSTLSREWVTAHDSAAPVDIGGTVGATTVYKPGGAYSSGSYEYNAEIPLTVKQDLSAIEVRLVLFDVWGQFTKTLSLTEVVDIPAGATKKLTPVWNVFSENEVSEFYASLTYVARARTKDGKVYEADVPPIAAEARKLSAKFEPSWLDPAGRPPADSSRRRP